MTDPDRTSIASHVAAVYLQAAVDETSVRLQEVFKDLIDETIGGMNWAWDAVGGVGRGAAVDTFSMSGKPSEFEGATVNGGILVRGTYAWSPEHEQLVVDLEAGFYFKTAADVGKLSNVVDLGSHIVDVSDDESMTYSPENSDAERSAVHDGIRGLIDSIVANPPPEALSRSKDAQKRRHQRQVMDSAVDAARQNSRADSGQYSDPEQVAALLDSDVFGIADLNAAIQRSGKKNPTPDDRAALRSALESLGKKFVPGSPMTLASGPDDVSSALRGIADWIDSSQSPSRGSVVAELKSIASALSR